MHKFPLFITYFSIFVIVVTAFLFNFPKISNVKMNPNDYIWFMENHGSYYFKEKKCSKTYSNQTINAPIESNKIVIVSYFEMEEKPDSKMKEKNEMFSYVESSELFQYC